MACSLIEVKRAARTRAYAGLGYGATVQSSLAAAGAAYCAAELRRVGLWHVALGGVLLADVYVRCSAMEWCYLVHPWMRYSELFAMDVVSSLVGVIVVVLEFGFLSYLLVEREVPLVALIRTVGIGPELLGVKFCQ